MTTFLEQVNQYLSWCQNTQGMSVETIKSKRWFLHRLYTDTGLQDIRELTNEIFDQWLVDYHSTEKLVATNRAISHLRGVVSYFRECGMVVPINLTLIKRRRENPPEQVYYPREVILKVAKQADAQTRLMILVAFDTGMRASELARLRLSEIHGCKLRFKAKCGLARETFISRETERLLRRYVEENSIENFLWPGKHEGHVAYNTLRNRVKHWFVQAGYEDFHLHALRHSFVADLERRGATVDEIYAMIGHRSYKSTQKYLHRIRSSENLLRLHKKFHKY